MALIKLDVFFDLLEQHDWQFQYSDDPYYYRRGLRERERLQNYASISTKHLRLYNQFADFHNKQSPNKPARPCAA